MSNIEKRKIFLKKQKDLLKLRNKKRERHLNSLPTIFLDLDGVLVDFLEGANLTLKKFNQPPWENDQYTNIKNKSQWSYLRRQPFFWRELPWTKDGRELWNFVKPYKPHILSAVPSFWFDAKQQKMTWISKNLGLHNLSGVHLVDRKDKQKFATASDRPNFLIDDLDLNTKEWTKNGGTSILHLNTVSTIFSLKRLGF